MRRRACRFRAAMRLGSSKSSGSRRQSARSSEFAAEKLISYQGRAAKAFEPSLRCFLKAFHGFLKTFCMAFQAFRHVFVPK